MMATKRVGVSARAYRLRTIRDDFCPLRPKPADRIVRWIGAGKRRSLKQADEAETEASDLGIVRLSWTDTFGRPDRATILALQQTAATDLQVLQFRRFPPDENTLLVQHQTNGQPSVPVLR